MEIAIWLGLLLLFGVLEAATVALVSLWFMAGALAALLAALCGAGLPVQVGVFLVVSAVLLAALPAPGAQVCDTADHGDQRRQRHWQNCHCHGVCG